MKHTDNPPFPYPVYPEDDGYDRHRLPYGPACHKY